MSLLRYYGGPAQMTREELTTWVNQVEDIAVAKAVAIKAMTSVKMTRLTVDLEIPKPAGKIKIVMGHLPGGPAAFQGQAFVTGQPMDVTLDR